jgi:hypothetical protein
MASYVKSMLIKLKVEKAELSNRQWAAEKCGNIEAHDHCQQQIDRIDRHIIFYEHVVFYLFMVLGRKT